MRRRERPARHRGSSGPDNVWPPLADVMLLAACAFLVVFVVALNSAGGGALANAGIAGLENDKSKRLGKAVVDLRGARATLECQRKQRRDREATLRTTMLDAARRLRAALRATPSSVPLGNAATQAALAEGLVIPIKARTLFARNEAKVRPEYARLLKGRVAAALAEVLSKDPQRTFVVRIEGHTDAVPYVPKGVATNCISNNWELSTRRATNVLQQLLESTYKVDKARIFASGFADTRLLRGKPERSGDNRRVVVRVMPSIESLSGLLGAPAEGMAQDLAKASTVAVDGVDYRCTAIGAEVEAGGIP